MADWQDEWQPVVDAIGQDFGGGTKREAVEDIEKSTIRRYCEPLEMDFPLFYDEAAAKAQGFKGIPGPVQRHLAHLDRSRRVEARRAGEVPGCGTQRAGRERRPAGRQPSQKEGRKDQRRLRHEHRDRVLRAGGGR